jgi:hypothetical protein
VIIALELAAAQSWFGPYFRFGIPIYFRRETAPVRSGLKGADLEPRFTNRPQLPRIRFKSLSRQWIAFHEAFFENRGTVHYVPVMHSSVQLDPQKNRLTIIGYLDWYVIFTFIYLVLRSLDDPSFSFVGVLVLFIFSLSYFVQRNINHHVAEELKNLLTEPE